MRLPAHLTTRLGNILADGGVNLEGAELDEAAARVLQLGVLMTRLAIHRSRFDEDANKRDRPSVT
jgi:hypothetical protein